MSNIVTLSLKIRGGLVMRQVVRMAVVAATLGAASPSLAAVTLTKGLMTVTAGSGNLFTYSLGGWQGGGVASGTFTAVDLDRNGQISSFANEVSAFTFNYSGGTIVGGFNLTFANLFGLVYDLNGGPLGDGSALAIEGVGASAGTSSFTFGPGPLLLCNGTNDCGRIEGPAAAGAVPEPSAWAMMIAGFGLIGGAMRRRLRSFAIA